jgi:GTP diphosphokinase / guanosine-3',5'-bis(diphosphate) 3'-diphosphatase
VVTAPNQRPSKDWLKFCVTNRAKSKIRNYIREEQRVQSLAVGKELLEREFRKHGGSLSRYTTGREKEEFVASFLSDFGLHKLEELYVRVGYGRMEPRMVVERLAPDLLKTPGAKTEVKGFLTQVFDSVRKKKSNSLIRVSGMDDMLVHFARCCSPIPGDPIAGFITLGRGVTIHRSDCPKGFQFDQDRLMEVEWNTEGHSSVDRTVRIQVLSQDSQGLLKAIAEAFSAQQMNIEGAQIQTTKELKAISIFTVSAQSTKQVQMAINSLQKVKGVIEVKRLLG